MLEGPFSEPLREVVRSLNDDWVAYRESCGPVAQADALLMFANAWFGFAGAVLEEEPEPEPRLELPADLHMEDDEGHGFAVLSRERFFPGVVYPGARVEAGRPDGFAWVTVLRTETLAGAGGAERVLVTFDKAPDAGPARAD